MNYNLFMQEIVETARNEARQAGFEELKTPEEVDGALKKEGTTLVLVNSVCGCAGGIARPAAAYALNNSEKKPDFAVTVFAGQDKEATEQARSYFTGYAPSSPSFALLKDGEIKTMIERHDIEGFEPQEVFEKLQQALNEYC
ncbi:BrxA/BrxB family bacilliredoxin [Bacillus taeanensis]|uniref:BrxA/BrxB family bacilliredoxin n=1 Tax=Bacillus taeanensis TaxID=273032 RepID=A0A366XYL2_9BACI|nr:BrxA/BrxB family bacilliredoxin [Bacillus taeanensis]RBW70658.1 BrxA/BrxB family bacilliredoxin [Bacillus taeanensis]